MVLRKIGVIHGIKFQQNLIIETQQNNEMHFLCIFFKIRKELIESVERQKEIQQNYRNKTQYNVYSTHNN